MTAFVLFNSEQRQRYAVNCELATRNPAEYLSLIVDGMDQNKTNVPNLVSLYFYTLSVAFNNVTVQKFSCA